MEGTSISQSPILVTDSAGRPGGVVVILRGKGLPVRAPARTEDDQAEASIELLMMGGYVLVDAVVNARRQGTFACCASSDAPASSNGLQFDDAPRPGLGVPLLGSSAGIIASASRRSTWDSSQLCRCSPNSSSARAGIPSPY